MSQKRMAKREIIEASWEKTNLKKKDFEAAYEVIMGTIQQSIFEGKDVYLPKIGIISILEKENYTKSFLGKTMECKKYYRPKIRWSQSIKRICREKRVQ